MREIKTRNNYHQPGQASRRNARSSVVKHQAGPDQGAAVEPEEVDNASPLGGGLSIPLDVATDAV